MKLCKDCKHYQPYSKTSDWGQGKGLFGGSRTVTQLEMCLHDEASLSPVDGVRLAPFLQRCVGACGADGVLFEPAVPI